MSVGTVDLLVLVQYCSGRGVCKASNQSLCDCWDPVRWTGSRCEISVCGEHGIVVGGDYSVGACRHTHLRTFVSCGRLA